MENSKYSTRKIILMASLGSVLEYYDFIIYFMLAQYLSQLFFPSSDPAISLIQTYAAFAIGSISKLLGGTIFGLMGDNAGRKKSFLTIMLLMAFSSFLIGFLPTYQIIGLCAPIALMFFRFLQSLSFGAEFPGAITIAVEFSKTKESCKNCSLIVTSATVGSILASFILFIFTRMFNEAAILAGVWRIPFLLGGLLAVIAFFMRKKLPESSCFTHSDSNLIDLLKKINKQHLLTYVLAMTSILFPATLIVVNLYFPVYLSQYLPYPSDQIYLAITISLIWSVISLPACGIIADRIGKKNLFLITLISFIVFGPILLKFFIIKNLFIFMIIHQTFISGAMASYMPLLPELFPSEIRYTSVAFCYNTSFIFASLFPILFTYMMKLNFHYDSLFWCLSAVAALSFVATIVPTKNSLYVQGESQ